MLRFCIFACLGWNPDYAPAGHSASFLFSKNNNLAIKRFFFINRNYIYYRFISFKGRTRLHRGSRHRPARRRRRLVNSSSIFFFPPKLRPLKRLNGLTPNQNVAHQWITTDLSALEYIYLHSFFSDLAVTLLSNKRIDSICNQPILFSLFQEYLKGEFFNPFGIRVMSLG